MLQLTFTRGLSEDLSSEVKVMKKVKGREAEEKEQAEQQLLKQDLYVESLTKIVEKLTEQIDVYESQVKGQAEDTRAFRLLQTEVSVTQTAVALTF
ncbi:Coiled-coil domain-containing protein 40 [Liparis tanakae]|uniref:Coiled-coil domain-containing protein 40 n=1 Tax=Liparis tanakae TaxID=230148 RepID=A0A4Z2EAS4_9TELE|nr:Coiled-coil domain-containing protein 40 [Liparis tanakae]